MTAYVLAAYDISDDSRRRRAALRLQSMGFRRVQKSVYIRRGGSTLAKEAYLALRRIAGASDSVLVIVVPDWSVERALGGVLAAGEGGGFLVI